MSRKRQLQGYYWEENKLIGNLGDALVPILIKALGYTMVSKTTTSAVLLNPQRCLLVIGSLLTEYDLQQITGPVDVWGCGWKGVRPSQEMLERLQIYAVRGPLTVSGLGLCPDTPLGDPALLLPRLTKLRMAAHGHTILVPHYHRAWLMPVSQRRLLTGCDKVVSPLVVQRQRLGQPGWIRKMRELNSVWRRLGIQPHTTWGAVKQIAGASFVLTGSLHGAIIAQAYGIPWAAYDDGYVDAPPKWQDWAAYLGIRIEFVTTLAAGQQWWQKAGRQGKVRDLDALLAAFPYPLPKTLLPSAKDGDENA